MIACRKKPPCANSPLRHRVSIKPRPRLWVRPSAQRATFAREVTAFARQLRQGAGIFKPDSGQVWFDGQQIDALSEAKRTELRRTAFGFIFQFGQLVPELTASDNVALPLLLNKVSRKQAYGQATSWLERLDLGELGGRRTGELSGGEAQRVALARALVMQPRVLFADEPTGSLDSLMGEYVMNMLVDLARQEGTTVVLVTHDARVAAYADCEIMVRDGKVTTPVKSEAVRR